MTPAIYEHAEIYALAFSFIDATKQVDRFEQYIAEHSRIAVRSALDVCCGPAVELREFARRGYTCTGLDASAEMLAYLAQKCEEDGVAIDMVQADMREFALPQPVDFACNMMGSIVYVVDTPGLLAHLACMAKALNPGGLYLCCCGRDEFGEEFFVNKAVAFSPVGYVVSSVEEPVDANWEEMISKIVLLPEYYGGLEGLEQFSHAFILTHLNKAKYQSEAHLQRHPRGLESLPLVGIFARRAKERPNPIGIMVVKVIKVGTQELEIQGLDAINGTPVLDIKPYFPKHDSIENAEIPHWIHELLKGDS